jgi:hypothetical protein
MQYLIRYRAAAVVEADSLVSARNKAESYIQVSDYTGRLSGVGIRLVGDAVAIVEVENQPEVSEIEIDPEDEVIGI